MRRTVLATAVILLAAFAAAAHGNYKHILGVVTAITDTDVTVQTQTKETQVVKIVADTSFVKSGAPSSLTELKVGDRVVIHAKPVGADLIAHEVRFGKMESAGPQAGKN